MERDPSVPLSVGGKQQTVGLMEKRRGEDEKL